MIIDTIGLKNMKSFGNKRQEIKFSKDKPQLILLTGRNGAGKSTIQESIDLAVFGKVRGKNRKNIPLSTLPNRINGNLELDIKFTNISDQDIFIQKKLNPNDFEILVNNVPFTNRFNLLDDKEKEKIIGFNYDMYKSFISMNINDFLNFIQLQKNDKRNLLNKLCNLEKLDSYLSIAKDILKNLNKKIEQIDDKISNHIKLIDEYNSTISNIENTEQKIKKDREIQVKNEATIIMAKIEIIKKNVKENIDVKFSEVENKIQRLKNELRVLENEYNVTHGMIERLDEKIKLFESGHCPMCETNLKDHTHTIELDDFNTSKIELLEKLEKIKIKKETILQSGRDEMVNKNSIVNSRDDEVRKYKELNSELSKLKDEYKALIESKKNNTTIEELKKSIDKLKGDNEHLEREKVEVLDKHNTYIKMVDLLDDGGIRSGIIKSIVKPINVNVSKFLSEINFKYKVVLDDEFNAKIFERILDEVNSETLSNGEIKIVNIVIALSYIKMIRSIKNINVLFLDEVFVSLDDDYIGLFLKLLKNMSQELGLNIVIIHHGISEVDLTYFDRVLKVSNSMFSKIEDIVR